MNKVLLTGHITKDVKLIDGQYQYVQNTLAVKRQFKSSNGEYETDFINFTIFGKQAETFAKYVHKGDKVLLEGNWQVNTYQGKDGSTVYSNSLSVERYEFLDLKPVEHKKEEEIAPYDFVNPKHEKKPFDSDTGLPF